MAGIKQISIDSSGNEVNLGYSLVTYFSYAMVTQYYCLEFLVITILAVNLSGLYTSSTTL